MALEPIAVGPARFRVGPWHQQVDIAHLIPLTTAPTLGREVLARARERLGSMGFESIFTAAVGPDERDAMLRDEFRVHEELHLLRLDLRRPVHQMPRSRHHPRLRRGRRRDHAALLRLDASAFGEFWRLDRDGLQDALAATPASRLRVTDDAARSGYSITGRSGPTANAAAWGACSSPTRFGGCVGGESRRFWSTLSSTTSARSSCTNGPDSSSRPIACR